MNEMLSRRKPREPFMENIKHPTESFTQDRRALSRRDFLAKTALAGAGLAIGPLAWGAASHQPREVNDASDMGP